MEQDEVDVMVVVRGGMVEITQKPEWAVVVVVDYDNIYHGGDVDNHGTPCSIETYPEGLLIRE